MTWICSNCSYKNPDLAEQCLDCNLYRADSEYAKDDYDNHNLFEDE